jgi:hypothetical protein
MIPFSPGVCPDYIDCDVSEFNTFLGGSNQQLRKDAGFMPADIINAMYVQGNGEGETKLCYEWLKKYIKTISTGKA